MPGLVAFGRRWSLGSDDLVFPGALELMLRVLWWIGILVLYLTQRDQFDCKGAGFLPSYLIVLIVLLAVIILAISVIVGVSMQGTITNPGPRRCIPTLIYIRTTLYIPELAWAVLGAIWVNDKSEGCAPSVVYTITIAVIASWLFLFFTMVAVFIFFDPLGRRKRSSFTTSGVHNLESSDSIQATSVAARVWERRLKLLCCCIMKDADNRAAFTNIGELFSAFFLDTDLVPGDIAAGLTLLHQEQDKREQSKDLEEVACSAPQPQSVAEELDIELENSAHFMQFAVAAYGWPLYIFSHPLTGICRLSHNCMCCRSQFPEQDMVGGDHLGCHFNSILQTTGLQYRDFIHVSFHNKIYEIPFYVALDHKKEAVVVAVRGTLSLEDALTDMSAERETLFVDCVTGESLAHKGILQAAGYIHKKLIDEGILNQAFTIVPEYKLVVTGHSLGAGAASILAMLLHDSYPELRCYAFSPPGGLLSKSLADYSKGFIISVVLGKDLIPRLSLGNIEDLKRRILRIVAHSNRPKYQILLRGCWYEVFGGDPDNFPSELDDRQQEQLAQPLLAEQNLLGQSSASYTSIPEGSPLSSPFQGPQLFLPGKIIYIVEERSTGSFCFSQAQYHALWSDASSFSNILISPRMITDHMPDLLFNVLKDLTRETPFILCPTSQNGAH
ncbi:diacylglycerol lipase-beta isoform X1 [Carcharodon carcharias]|uniref:diacylglycerol lipase-beta isoform X1 n=2 Tax=Carcharodon carcharias TaxID=13397 RepID=UPI001B7EDE76|nr:diacylglycerol lipase-beta isoform X1 [Carcharodon carcharias]